MHKKSKSSPTKPFQKSCYVCKGIALYSQSMNSAGKKPYCIGKEIELTNPWDIENLKEKIYNEKIEMETTAKASATISNNNNNKERKERNTNYNDILQWNWLNAFYFVSHRNVQWNYLHLPSSSESSSASSKVLKKRKDIYITPLQYLFLRPPDKRKFVVYCFGKTIYEETFDHKTNLVPNVVKGFYHIQWKKRNDDSIDIPSVPMVPKVKEIPPTTASSSTSTNESLELWAGDFWIAAPTNTHHTSTSISSIETKHRPTTNPIPIRSSSSTLQKYMIKPQQHQVRDIRRRQHSNPIVNGLIQYRMLCDTIGLKVIQRTRNAVNEWHSRRSRR